jgi:urease accessory protein
MPDSIAASSHQRSRGGASLHFGVARGRTRLADLHESSPLRILFPEPEPGEPPVAALVNTAGGLAGGDALNVEVTLGAGAQACVSSPAAEKIYRSLGPETAITARLEVGPAAGLEWIPQETILFDGARLTRRLEADVAAGGWLLMAEMLVFGRHARGEVLRSGRLLDSWRLRREGRLLWADALALEDGWAERLASPFGFGGAEAMATLVLLGDGPLEAARDALRETGIAATLPRPGLLVLRWLGGATAVRDGLGQAIRELRAGLLGRPDALPRLWTC